MEVIGKRVWLDTDIVRQIGDTMDKFAREIIKLGPQKSKILATLSDGCHSEKIWKLYIEFQSSEKLYY